MSARLNHIADCDCAITYDIRDNHGVLLRYKVTRQDVLEICGGIPIRSQLYANVAITSTSEHTITVCVASDLYFVFRTINFNLKIIFNDKMRVYQKGQHIGTSLFLNQVAFARKLGFVKLKVTAIDYDGMEKADGYYRWARLGYQMTDGNDVKDFADQMRSLSRPERTLSELVLSEHGYQIWKVIGQTWTGKFRLVDDSPSMLHLQQYLKIKGIDFKL
ncbi:MAG TPA: hypothetical protein VGS79_06555 [Puia sp.]|nr:hypothetical protein [Puia sp.]